MCIEIEIYVNFKLVRKSTLKAMGKVFVIPVIRFTPGDLVHDKDMIAMLAFRNADRPWVPRSRRWNYPNSTYSQRIHQRLGEPLVRHV